MLESKKDRYLYRFLEIVPGALSWLTLLTAFSLSFFRPVWLAIFIIIFDVYWLSKVVRLAVRLWVSFGHFKRHQQVNWLDRCCRILGDNFTKYYHLIILPTFRESQEVVDGAVKSLTDSDYPLKQVILVLALEEKDQANGLAIARYIESRYGHLFKKFLFTVHPHGLEGEIPGKGSNEAYAARKIKIFFDAEKIPYEKVITSTFDADTCVHPKYLSCLAYHYLIQKNPARRSYQPIPVFHNNVWQSPAVSRMVAAQTSFWMMMEQERQSNLLTFSSHAMSFKALVDIDFWQTNIVSEDSRIFYQCFFHYQGNYQVVPLYLPVSMDTVLNQSYFKTLVSQYKQQRRWAWGVENAPYVIFRSIKDKTISWRKKLHYIFYEIEGSYSWATTSLIILFLGWLPVVLGGQDFKATILASKLPFTTQILMTLSMVGLFVPLFIYLKLLPSRPTRIKKGRWLTMILQWLLFPVTAIVFGSVVALDAQTRLMLRKYMGFTVTPKIR